LARRWIKRKVFRVYIGVVPVIDDHKNEILDWGMEWGTQWGIARGWGYIMGYKKGYVLAKLRYLLSFNSAFCSSQGVGALP